VTPTLDLTNICLDLSYTLVETNAGLATSMTSQLSGTALTLDAVNDPPQFITIPDFGGNVASGTYIWTLTVTDSTSGATGSTTVTVDV